MAFRIKISICLSIRCFCSCAKDKMISQKEIFPFNGSHLTLKIISKYAGIIKHKSIKIWRVVNNRKYIQLLVFLLRLTDLSLLWIPYIITWLEVKCSAMIFCIIHLSPSTRLFTFQGQGLSLWLPLYTSHRIHTSARHRNIHRTVEWLQLHSSKYLSTDISAKQKCLHSSLKELFIFEH